MLYFTEINRISNKFFLSMKLHSLLENVFLIALTAYVTHEADVLEVFKSNENFNL